jgi:hypothetical protein
MNLREWKDAGSKAAFGMTATEAWAQKICIRCKQPPTFTTKDGQKEYYISGLCEPCFDGLYEANEEERATP